jgi:hypothetical protein
MAAEGKSEAEREKTVADRKPEWRVVLATLPTALPPPPALLVPSSAGRRAAALYSVEQKDDGSTYVFRTQTKEPYESDDPMEPYAQFFYSYPIHKCSRCARKYKHPDVKIKGTDCWDANLIGRWKFVRGVLTCEPCAAPGQGT